jgi:hypothetical protein
MVDANPPPDLDDGSNTDLDSPPQDRMLTDSPESSYSPSITAHHPSDDGLSANASEDLSTIYVDQRFPPQELHAESFDLMDYKVALSQQAFLHYQQIDEHITNTLPQQCDEFNNLLSQAVRKNNGNDRQGLDGTPPMKCPLCPWL